MKTFIPSMIHEKLKAWFGFPQQETHVQVATSSENHPHIRTMKIYEITQEGSCIVLSHTQTQKWRDLQVSPYIALLFIHFDFGQIVVEGKAQLLTRESNQILRYWERMPEPIQRIYFSSAEKEISEHFGVISVQPLSWEILEINKNDYNKSVRRKFIPDNGSWKSQEIRPV